MNVPSYIARRYLRTKRKTGFISIITLISIVGITIGVAALVIVLSVFNGFNGLVTRILINFDPHIRIEAAHGTRCEDASKILQQEKNNPEFKGISPYVVGKAMVLSPDRSRVIFLKGIDISTFGSVSGVGEKIAFGKFSLGDDGKGIIIGLGLADRLNVMIGDSIAVISPGGVQATLTQLSAPEIRRFYITGIYESNNKDYDGLYAFVSLHSAQMLFDLGTDVNGVEIRLNEFSKSEFIAQELRQQYPSDNIQTWYDLHKDLYLMMRIERWIAYIIVCLIIAVATFNLLGSLTMSVIEKTRDIGILRSFGVQRNGIASIFLFEGAFVGFLGTIFGLLLGWIICYLQISYQLFALDPTVYIIPALPVEMHWDDFLLVGCTAICLATIAAWYPARRAAQLIPTEAIQWE